MALKLVRTGPAVFQVRGGYIAPVRPTSWAFWQSGRIYPPPGTYWVETTSGVSIEKRGSETVKLTSPALVTVTDGDYLLLQFMQDGQAIRVTPV